MSQSWRGEIEVQREELLAIIFPKSRLTTGDFDNPDEETTSP